jgi:regulator of replication initiation timing
MNKNCFIDQSKSSSEIEQQFTKICFELQHLNTAYQLVLKENIDLILTIKALRAKTEFLERILKEKEVGNNVTHIN